MGWNAIVKNLLRNYLYGIRKLVFKLDINVSPSTVWKMLWEKENYTMWTQTFSPGSYYTGDLKPGERIHFLAPSGEGIYSDVAYYKENELMMFRHIGMMKNKEELPVDAETEKWTGIFETYRLNEKKGNASLQVEVDAIPGYAAYLDKTFPLALNKLKEMCEMKLPE